MLGHETRAIRIDVLRTYMQRLLEAVGLDREAAATVADVHLESDLRGVGVQGFNHLINSHLQYYRKGEADPVARPVIVREKACFALIDGNSGPGPLAALLAADVASIKAKDAGCAVVGVRNSHDLFHAGLYAERMANRDVIGMVFSDDVVPVVHPVGGRRTHHRKQPHGIFCADREHAFSGRFHTLCNASHLRTLFPALPGQASRRRGSRQGRAFHARSRSGVRRP